MKRNLQILVLLQLLYVGNLFAQPTAAPATGYTWVKTGSSQYVSAPTSTSPSVAFGQNTSFSLPDSDPTSCAGSCIGLCDAPSQYIGKKVFGTSVHNASACEQRAHTLNHWNNPFPNSGVANGATSGTVHLPTAAALTIIQGTPGTGGGGSTNHGYVIGGWGGINQSMFSVAINWAITWSTVAFGGFSGNSGPQLKTATFQGFDPGGSGTSGLIEWSTGFGTSFGANYLIPVTSLPQTGGTFEMVYTGVSNISVSRVWGNADGEVVHSPGMEGRASHTVDYDIWVLQAPLPVKLINFDAQKRNHSAAITFTTTTESNMKLYELEKSNDTKNWTAITSFLPKNDRNTTQKYEYSDLNINENATYYRLKMIENDGKTSYSRVVSLTNLIKGNAVNVFPNPTKNNLQLELNMVADQENASLEIYNIQGQLVKQRTLSLVGGLQNIALDIEDLETGVFTLKVKLENAQEVIIKKIQKI
jgi:hypothetical protein